VKDGFPRGVQFTPVPNPLLASLLEEMDSLNEMKVVMRVIHGLHKLRKVPASIGFDDLFSDRTVASMLKSSGTQLEEIVELSINSAAERGILLVVDQGNAQRRILLNTEPVRRALARQGVAPSIKARKPFETWANTKSAETKQDAVTFYEQNIASVTPIVAENIQAALEQHPEDELVLAIRYAAEANARSWNYIAAILRRWATEGRPEELDDGSDGTTERHLQEDRSDQFYEEYLKRQRARGAN